MVLGHAAVGLLTNQFLFRRVPLLVCLAAAYGPDWIDKPLKLFLGLPGHGLGHSILGAAGVFCALTWLWRRFRFPVVWLWAAAALWGTHWLCDMVRQQVLFWPLFGSFPMYDGTTVELAKRFYATRPVTTWAMADLALVLVAVAARLWPLAKGLPDMHLSRKSRLTPRKIVKFY